MVLRTDCVFCPAEVLQFLPIAREMELLDKILRLYEARRKKGAGIKGAFYHAWKRAHRTNDEIDLPSLGAEKFWDMFVEAIKLTDLYLEYLIGNYFFPKALSLRTYNTSANELDPVGLMYLWQKMEKRTDTLACQAAFEARRNFAIASQLFQLELVDPDGWISKDVIMLENLAANRLFAEDSATVYAVFRLNSSKQRRLIEEPRVTFDKAEAERWANDLRAKSESHQRVVMSEFPCRIIKHNGFTQFVLSDDPRKRMFSRAMKHERECIGIESGYPVVKDSRRGLYVVAAVLEHGELRVPTREDALRLFAYVCEKLWGEAPLAIEHIRSEEESSKKPNRNIDYWDVKLIGTISRDEEDRIIRSFVEQKVTTLRDGINEAYATDNLNHGIRRGEQLLTHVNYYWDREIFGVNWEDQEVRRELYEYWKERFSLKC